MGVISSVACGVQPADLKHRQLSTTSVRIWAAGWTASASWRFWLATI